MAESPTHSLECDNKNPYENLWDHWGTFYGNGCSCLSRNRHIFKLLEAFTSKKGSQRVLDLGCGNGNFLKKLSSRIPEAKFYGVDYIPKAIEIAKDNFKSGSFIVGDVQQDTLYPKGSFDTVVSLDVISSIPDIKSCLKALHSWLKKDGIFIFSTPSGKEYYHKSDEIIDYSNRFEYEEIDTLLQEQGFKRLELYCWGRIFYMMYMKLFLNTVNPDSIYTLTESPIGKIVSPIANTILYNLFKVDDLIKSKKGPCLFGAYQKLG